MVTENYSKIYQLYPLCPGASLMYLEDKLSISYFRFLTKVLFFPMLLSRNGKTLDFQQIIYLQRTDNRIFVLDWDRNSFLSKSRKTTKQPKKYLI